jgi:hypothetical protein
MTLATNGTDWEHKRRSVPAGEVNDIPDGATTWACLERTGNRGIPITITVYRTPEGLGYVTVTVDGEREVFKQFDDVDAAAEEANDLMDEYAPAE